MPAIANRILNITVIIIALWSAIATANEGIIRFPSDRTEISSPDGRYILYNVDYDKTVPHHALFLKNLKNKSEKKILSYDRYVDVLWSPKGTGLIVNDHGGSDYTNSIIFLLNGIKKSVDLRASLRQKMGGNKTIFENHHVYIESTEWIDENRVKVKISGYGDIDPEGFILWYEYPIGDGFKRIKN